MVVLWSRVSHSSEKLRGASVFSSVSLPWNCPFASLFVTCWVFRPCLCGVISPGEDREWQKRQTTLGLGRPDPGLEQIWVTRRGDSCGSQHVALCTVRPHACVSLSSYGSSSKSFWRKQYVLLFLFSEASWNREYAESTTASINFMNVVHS